MVEIISMPVMIMNKILKLKIENIFLSISFNLSAVLRAQSNRLIETIF